MSSWRCCSQAFAIRRQRRTQPGAIGRLGRIVARQGTDRFLGTARGAHGKQFDRTQRDGLPEAIDRSAVRREGLTSASGAEMSRVVLPSGEIDFKPPSLWRIQSFAGDQTGPQAGGLTSSALSTTGGASPVVFTLFSDRRPSSRLKYTYQFPSGDHEPPLSLGFDPLTNRTGGPPAAACIHKPPGRPVVLGRKRLDSPVDVSVLGRRNGLVPVLVPPARARDAETSPFQHCPSRG